MRLSSRLSLRICATRRPRRAPNAARIAISLRRPVTRASNRLATFTHASSRRSPTAPRSNSSAGRMYSNSACFHPHHGHIPACQPGRLRIDAARDGAQLGLRLSDGDARLQAGDDAEIVIRAVLGAQFRDRPGHVKVAGQRLPEIRQQARRSRCTARYS